ncbi:MAG: hypothetical protein AB1730_25115 [Myxococcota bacterium]|jgi:hypothetical protein
MGLWALAAGLGCLGEAWALELSGLLAPALVILGVLATGLGATLAVFPSGSGAVESAHKHVLQSRMKRAGQRWRLLNARRMAHLRAAYRTAGAANVYDSIQRARRDTEIGRARPLGRRNTFRFARQGLRDQNRALKAASN